MAVLDRGEKRLRRSVTVRTTVVAALSVEVPVEMDVGVDQAGHQRRVAKLVRRRRCRRTFVDARDLPVLHRDGRLTEVRAAAIEHAHRMDGDRTWGSSSSTTA